MAGKNGGGATLAARRARSTRARRAGEVAKLRRDPRVRDIVRQAVEDALGSPEYADAGEVQVGIASARGFASRSGVVTTEMDGGSFSLDGGSVMDLLRAARKAVGPKDAAEDAPLDSRVLPKSAEEIGRAHV